MSKIISKIGISEFKDCLNSDTVKAMTKDNKENVEAIGMTVMLDMGSIILSHVSDCETELYKFLSDLTGESIETLMNDSIAEFAELVIAIFKKEEFKDFIGVVSRLLK